MALARQDFQQILKPVKKVFMEHSYKQGYNHAMMQSMARNLAGGRHGKRFANKRRISKFDTFGHPAMERGATLLRNLARFTTECLWLSMYGKLFKYMTVNPDKVSDLGDVAFRIMRDSPVRKKAMDDVRRNCKRVLEMEPANRSKAEHTLILGLLRQPNMLKDSRELCEHWSPQQYEELCKTLRFWKVPALQQVWLVPCFASWLVARGLWLVPCCASWLVVRGLCLIFPRGSWLVACALLCLVVRGFCLVPRGFWLVELELKWNDALSQGLGCLCPRCLSLLIVYFCACVCELYMSLKASCDVH